jgi:hypothetical protein
MDTLSRAKILHRDRCGGEDRATSLLLDERHYRKTHDSYSSRAAIFTAD